MHCYKDPSRGVNIIISKAVEHDSVPPHKDYSRSEIYMGINIFMPSKRNPMHTEFTSIAHTRYSGILPYLVSKTSLSASVSYLKNLKAVAVPLSKKESN